MGADLYLESEFNSNQARFKEAFNTAVIKRDQCPRDSKEAALHQREVSEAYGKMHNVGYFHDSYNEYGLFAQLDLSWWQDVIPLLDEENKLPLDNAKKLIEMVRAAKLDTSKAREVAKQQKDEPPKGGWDASYEEQRQELITFLEHSIEVGEPILCSL